MFYVLDAPPSPFSPTPDGRQNFIAQALFAINGLRANLEQQPFDHSSGTKVDVIQLPKFAADFVAAISIAKWEQSGQRKYLDESLPPSEVALQNLEAHVLADPDSYFGQEPATTPLHELVGDVWIKSFPFSGEFGTCLLVAEPDEAALIEAIAQLLLDRATAITKKGPTNA